ncbi:MAG: GNAT family N-acetyltransferase [Dehalococcoidia bacterium]
MDSPRSSPPLTDLDLLELQAEMSMDNRRRIAGACGVTIAVARDGQRLFIGSDVPDTLVAALVAAVDRSPLAPVPDVGPPALGACRAIVESCCGPLSVEAGPSYLIEGNVQFALRAEIVRSDAPPDERLRRLNPGNWEPDEWGELLGGVLGPWAMAVGGRRVVSICHTPARMTERAAECGVWTQPDYRGRGYAAAVTAAWAEILRPSGRYLFYSTDAENVSSQRVAARLGLRLIGWMWRLSSAGGGQSDQRHPLSRRRTPPIWARSPPARRCGAVP